VHAGLAAERAPRPPDRRPAPPADRIAALVPERLPPLFGGYGAASLCAHLRRIGGRRTGD
jgi:hypothetical protein